MENMKKYIGKCYKAISRDTELILVTDVDEENQGVRATIIKEAQSGGTSVTVGEFIPFDELSDNVDEEVDRRDFREVYARVRGSIEETMATAFRAKLISEKSCERE